ncbi:unnamed protein product, partial [Prorocentrum cordatum]
MAYLVGSAWTRLYLAGDARRKAVRRLVRPRRVDGDLPQGPLLPPAPRDWEPSPIGDATQLEAAIDSWYRAARGTFTTLTGVPAPWFRPYFRWEPAAGRPASRHAGASSLAVAWRDCSARAFETAAILGRPQPATHDELILARHWSLVRAAVQRAARAPGESPDAFRTWAAAFGHAQMTRGVSAMRSLAARAAQHAKRVEDAVAAARLAAYRSALAAPGGARTARTSAFAPGRLAFQYTRGIGGWARSPAGAPRCEQDVPDADPLEYDDFDAGRVEVSLDGRARAAAAPLSEQAALDHEARGWADQWAVGEDYREPYFPAHLLVDPQPLTMWSLGQAIASFPVGTGPGADHLAPRALQRLPGAARLRLCHILLAAERLGRWTAACNLVLIVLLPKPDGGLRPIGLFPTLIRIWMRARATVARAWEAAHALPSVFGSAGRGAQRAAWAATFAAEASAASARHHVASLLDLVKAFERIPRHLVAAAAVRLGFDLVVLRLSLASYRLARAIGVEGTFSCLLVATRGITAGSGFATVELQMLLHESMLIAMFRWPLLQLLLYVDDLTITASGFPEEALAAVSRGTEFFVDMFEKCLQLTVSPTKSFAVASRPRLAVRLSLMSKRRLLVPKRSVKMLGTPYAGGRARRQRIDVTKVVKAIGSPSMLYGVDIVGASSTHLHSVRVAALRAALPPGASRNVDVGFAVLGAGGSCLDPAFAAHATPLRHWGMAYWQGWAPAAVLDAVFELSRDRLANVLASGRSPWSAVAGPVAGVIATAWRLGWTCTSPRRFTDDIGEPVDFLLLSPAMVAAAVHRLVDRWRAQRVISAFPALVAGEPDMPLGQGAGAVTILVGRPLGALLEGRGRPRSTVPQWSGPCRSQLLSAATGGQWPQVRIAKLRNADAAAGKACQLCGVTPGTLMHRRVCEASLPPDGWPEPPEACRRLLSVLPEARLTFLRTRGLLALRLPRPVPQEEAAVRWFTDPPDATRADLCWYTDGSMKFGPVWELRRTGCALVVVSENGDLAAYGCAVPPPWIRTAAAAELWAVMLVLTITLRPPTIRTDCRALLAAAAAGTARATQPTRMLAQVWSRVSTLVDGDISELVSAGKLTWMPAHGNQTVIGTAMRSDEHVVTAIDWRANRLADVLAKAAAGGPPPCGPASARFAIAERLVAHEAAVLGAVTYAANHRERILCGPGGALKRVTVRDSAAVRRPRARPRAAAAPAPPVALAQPPALVGHELAGLRAAHAPAAWPRAALGARGKVRAAAARAASAGRAAADAAAAQAICAARAAALRPSSAPPAAERLAALRARVLARV